MIFFQNAMLQKQLNGHIFILKGRLWLSITGDTEDDNFLELKIMSSLSLHNAASKKKKIVNVILLNGEAYQVTVDVSRSIDTLDSSIVVGKWDST